MHFSNLSVEDMENLLRFSSEIYESGSGYLEASLKLLESLFGYKMTAVSCVDDITGQNEINIYARGNGLTSDFLYHTQLLNLNNSSMFRIADNATRSNDWNGVFYMQDVQEEMYTNKEYMDYLRSNNIKCYAKMMIDRSPLTSVHICKGYEEDLFDQREREILSYISHVLSSIARREHEVFDMNTSLTATERYLDSRRKALVIYSTDRHYMHHNRQFLQFAQKHRAGISASSYLRFIIRSIEDSYHIRVDNLYDEFQCSVGDDRITVIPCHYPGINNKPERYVTIIIGCSDLTTVPDVSRIRKYGLTKRETEIIRMVMAGSTSRDIAKELCISLPTVKTHISRIYSKLGVTNKVEALNKLRG